MFTNIITELSNGILTIGINRPSHKNAITNAMYQRIADDLTNANENSDVRVVVLHGAETAFSSGNDIDEFSSRISTENEPASSHFMKALLHFQKPVIAAVNGPAVGIGATMLLHCDLVYAGADAYVSFPFSRLGLCAEFASSLALAHIVGYHRAAELLLLGERCNADKAERLGIFNEVLPPADVLPKAIAVGRTLSQLSQPALLATKSLMRARDTSLYEQQRHIEMRQFTELLDSPEARWAFQAFMSRRSAPGTS